MAVWKQIGLNCSSWSWWKTINSWSPTTFTDYIGALYSSLSILLTTQNLLGTVSGFLSSTLWFTVNVLCLGLTFFQPCEYRQFPRDFNLSCDFVVLMPLAVPDFYPPPAPYCMRNSYIRAYLICIYIFDPILFILYFNIRRIC